LRNLAILIFQTLDGVMQAPGAPSEGFPKGGWANDCWTDVMEQVGREAMAENYDVLLGRNTYNTFVSSFSDVAPGDPVADTLNQAKKYVVTSDTNDLSWKNSVKINSQDVAGEILKLKQEDGPLLQVHGSWQLIQLLLSNQLIDEFRIWTFPVVVGEGKRLFADGAVPTKFQLTQFETSPSGALMHFYKRAV